MSQTKNKAITIDDDQAMRKAGQDFIASLTPPQVIYLHGALGAGKTTLSRGMIQSLLPTTRVPSPSFTLIESYQTHHVQIHHIDCYRLQTPEEILALGIADLYEANSIFLIEWPDKAKPYLPSATHHIVIDILPSGKRSLAIQQTDPTNQTS
jgi:tRNA threonylcarbamoyladenosine biosynthesis protein TsaE